MHPIVVLDSAGRPMASGFVDRFASRLHKNTICLLHNPTRRSLQAPAFMTANIKCVIIEESVRYTRCDRILADEKIDINAIFTTQKRLDLRLPRNKMVWIPYGVVWVADIEKYPYNKEQFSVSFLPGAKNMSCFPGHQMRYEINSLLASTPAPALNLHPNLQIEHILPTTRIPKKELIFDGHQYSIVVENCSDDGFFTEKLNDALISKTIPIYYGAPDIGDHFNLDGILQFTNASELKNILSSLTPEMYKEKAEAVDQNREILLEKYVNMKKQIGEYLSENYE